MKNLTKKLVNLGLTAGLVGSLILPCNAQEKVDEDYLKRKQFSIGVAHHNYQSKEMKEVYSKGGLFSNNSKMLRGSVNTTFGKHLGAETTIGYMAQDGKPYVEGDIGDAKPSVHLDHLELNVIGMIIPWQKKEAMYIPYIGAGVCYIMNNEKIDLDYGDHIKSSDETFSELGKVFVVGADFPLGRTLSLYVQGSYNSAKVNGVWGETDIGGKNFEAGLRINVE